MGMDFDATSLYPSAMRDDKTVYPKIQNGFALKPHVKDVYVDAFNNALIETGMEVQF